MSVDIDSMINPLTRDFNYADELDIKKFPFMSRLSLMPLIEFWTQDELNEERKSIQVSSAQEIQQKLKSAPELFQPITDSSVIDENRELIDLMLTAVVPEALNHSSCVSVIPPFDYTPFYVTSPFRDLLMGEGGTFVDQLADLDTHTRIYVQILYAYSYIVTKFYGLELDCDHSTISSSLDPVSGLVRHLKLDFDSQFCRVNTVGKPKKLTNTIKKNLLSNLSGLKILLSSLSGELRGENFKPITGAAQKTLLANVTGLKLLMELLKPETFEFQGFIVVSASDVTERQVLSSIEQDLVEKESITNRDRFAELQEKLRTVLRLPEMTVSLLGIQGEQVWTINSGEAIEQDSFDWSSTRRHRSELDGSIYERAINQGGHLVIEDLSKLRKRTEIEDRLIEEGVKSIVVEPLYDQDEPVGILELRAVNTGDLNSMNAMKLWDIVSLFSSAVKRRIDDFTNSVQTIIKEKCTAIHPSIEWRFRDAALNLLDRQRSGETVTEMEEIEFREVYPLYGQSDIRGSSSAQNKAAQTDLSEQLSLAKEIVTLAYDLKPMPFLLELVHRIDQKLSTVRDTDLGAGVESETLEFIRDEVEIFFPHMQNFDSGLERKVESYRRLLDPKRDTIHRARRDYEESVALINETISAYIDQEQKKAQQIFPHYFEKKVTDGVDHGIYVGKSMIEDAVFDSLYLKNLRLWQFMMVCGCARLSHQLQSQLKLPLNTCHLIVVQQEPISVKFNIDEKQLVVSGSYDTRYEVLKSRMDKSYVRGTNERLTQIGKIAIVYSNQREEDEYRQCAEYLHTTGYLANEIEMLELDDLQSVHGLKAIRVTVNTAGHSDVGDVDFKE